jgi:hypothetical protein
VFQNWRIPSSERGREGPSGVRKYLEKKISLPEEDISKHLGDQRSSSKNLMDKVNYLQILFGSK